MVHIRLGYVCLSALKDMIGRELSFDMEKLNIFGLMPQKYNSPFYLFRKGKTHLAVVFSGLKSTVVKYSFV